MKRISLTLSLLFLFLVLVQSSFAIGQEAEVLRKNGTFTLSRSELNTYYEVCAFVLDRSLSLSEKAQIRQIVFEGFDEHPQVVKKEIVSLSWALSEISQLGEATKVAEVRVRFRQQMIDYQAKGEENPLVSLMLANL